jgi:hypothetical protein
VRAAGRLAVGAKSAAMRESMTWWEEASYTPDGGRTVPVDNLRGASERRYAVAIHEAGHAVAFAAVGIDVVSVWIGPGPDPSGRTESGDFVGADRSDFLATLYASDIAVEELCDGYRLPIVESTSSDQEQLRRAERDLGIKDDERSRAKARAREIVLSWREHLVALANVLVVAPNERLVGGDLDSQLAPIRKQFTA